MPPISPHLEFHPNVRSLASERYARARIQQKTAVSARDGIANERFLALDPASIFNRLTNEFYWICKRAMFSEIDQEENVKCNGLPLTMADVLAIGTQWYRCVRSAFAISSSHYFFFSLLLLSSTSVSFASRFLFAMNEQIFMEFIRIFTVNLANKIFLHAFFLSVFGAKWRRAARRCDGNRRCHRWPPVLRSTEWA